MIQSDEGGEKTDGAQLPRGSFSTRPMLRFKAFEAVQGTRAGAELMHMIKKRQLQVVAGDEGCTATALFYALAA
jgi:hypothetical protein